MRNLIGDKNSFGIEYKIQSKKPPHVMGRMMLWLEGKCIGTFEDEDIISLTLNFIEGFELRAIQSCQFVNDQADMVYRLIDGLENNSGYTFSPCPPFDDYVIYCFACDDRLHFIWKLRDKPCFAYPGYLDYPKNIQSAVISVDEFRKVVAEFRRAIGVFSENDK